MGRGPHKGLRRKRGWTKKAPYALNTPGVSRAASPVKVGYVEPTKSIEDLAGPTVSGREVISLIPSAETPDYLRIHAGKTRTKLHGDQTFLYRFFSRSGELLYVGITNNWSARLKQHRAGKPWYREAVRVELNVYPSRDAADRAERFAIRHERPLHNLVHNRRSK